MLAVLVDCSPVGGGQGAEQEAGHHHAYPLAVPLCCPGNSFLHPVTAACVQAEQKELIGDIKTVQFYQVASLTKGELT